LVKCEKFHISSNFNSINRAKYGYGFTRTKKLAAASFRYCDVIDNGALVKHYYYLITKPKTMKN
jgi:hypothetical protein